MQTDEECANHGRNIAKQMAQMFGEMSPAQYENCILLQGHVGAGKTTFARGLIRELSPSTEHQDIPSPTFCLDFEYELDDDNLSMTFTRGVHHLDLYRLPGTNPNDLHALEFSELTRNGITLVEWPDRLETRAIVLPGALRVDIELSNMNAAFPVTESTSTKYMTEDMFEQLIAVPRCVTYGCSADSIWAPYIQSL